MARNFTLDEAIALLPEAQQRIAGVVVLQRELLEIAAAVEADAPAPDGVGVAEAKALDARIHDELGWFERCGIEVKGIAPALLDFPTVVSGHELLLCWLQGEPTIAWYHPPDVGFIGRAPLAELTLD